MLGPSPAYTVSSLLADTSFTQNVPISEISPKIIFLANSVIYLSLY